MSVDPIPKGYHSVIPYLIISRASDAIEFYKRAFDATVVMRLDAPGGKVGHAELKIGDSHVMLADEMPEMGHRGPEALGGSPISLLLYVMNVDSTYQKAVAAGAKPLRPVEDQFYGDRAGTLSDPFGHTWSIATHKEDVPEDELRKRFAQMTAKNGG